jgi:hypothetical protein
MGLLFETVPMLLPGHRHGELITKRACPACMLDLISSCSWCAGISSPGFWVEELCNGETRLLRHGTHSCPQCN